VSAFVEVFSTRNSGSKVTDRRIKRWVGFGGAFRELSNDGSIFVIVERVVLSEERSKPRDAGGLVMRLQAR